MKFKAGDKVKFLNEVGEGVITKLASDDLVHVKIEDGFEIPMKTNELVLIERAEETSFEKARQANGTEEDITETADFELSEINLLDEANLKINVVLGLLPNRINQLSISDLDLYIINDSNFGILYMVGTLQGNEVSLVARGMLEDNSKLYLRSFNQSDLSKSGKLLLQAIPFGQDRYVKQTIIDKSYDLKAYDFYRAKTYKSTEYFDSKAIILGDDMFDFDLEVEKLSQTGFAKVIREKGDEPSEKPQEQPKKEKQFEEIDLHIHEIIDDYKGLSNGEILEIQLGRFETVLEGALKGNQSKIVFIHGVGNGKLKHELRKKLDRKYPKLRYQDASFKEYGYGATMVYLK